MRHPITAAILAALVGCAPSLARFDDPTDLPTLDVRGDVAPAEDAGRPDVAPDVPDASDGAVAPDGAVDASETTPDAPSADTSDAADVARVDVSTDTPADADPCGGACDALPHVARATCETGAVCAVRMCERGFADCNRASVDGCETPTTTRIDCGSCGVRCGTGRVCVGGSWCG